MPSLEIRSGERAGTTTPLWGSALVIGRSPDCDIQVDVTSAASRRHAEVYPFAGGWRIRDLESSNGTRLNGRKILDEPLREGDRLEVGDFLLSYSNGEVAFEEKPASPVQPVAPAPPPSIPPSSPAPGDPEDIREMFRRLSAKLDLVEREIGKVLAGQAEITRHLLTVIRARGAVAEPDERAD